MPYWFFGVIHQIWRSHGLKNQQFEFNLSKITRPVAAIKSLRFALLRIYMIKSIPFTLICTHAFCADWATLKSLWCHHDIAVNVILQSISRFFLGKNIPNRMIPNHSVEWFGIILFGIVLVISPSECFERNWFVFWNDLTNVIACIVESKAIMGFSVHQVSISLTVFPLQLKFDANSILFSSKL